MRALLSPRVGMLLYRHRRPSTSAQPAVVAATLCSSAADTSGSASNSALQWQSEMDASLYRFIANAKHKLYYAAGQMAISEPFTLFFREAPQAPGQQEDLQPSPAGARKASLITLPLDLKAPSSSSSSSSSNSSSSTGTLAAAAQPLLQPLIDAAAASSFGRGKISVYDSAYHTALELPASHAALNIQHPPAEVLQQIQTLLRPSTGAVVADFVKLDICRPGDSTQPTIDTPSSSDVFGSLVMCLPSPHTGGGLVLRHSKPDVSHCFDWSLDMPAGTSGVTAAASSSQQLGSLQWAAFYSDSEHEVLPVTDGYRITLTYNLRAVGRSSGYNSDTASALNLTAAEAEDKDTAPGEAVDIAADSSDDDSNEEALPPVAARAIPGDASWLTAADVASSAGLVRHIKKLLADERWHPEGDTLGFVLQHKYAQDFKGLADVPFPSALKGPDRVLFASLVQAGLEPKVVPMFRSWTGPADFDDLGELYKGHRAPEIKAGAGKEDAV